MCNLKKCPICELNYIADDQECCEVCNPKNNDKLISTYEEMYESKRQKKFDVYKKRRKSMQEFYSIRYER